MFRPVFSCLLISMNVLIKAETCATFCKHKVNESAPLHFQNAVDTEIPIWSQPGEWLDLDCCADGFTEVEWYYHSLTNMTWQSWPWFSPCKYCVHVAPYRELCDKDQKLQFRSVSKLDKGRYRCNVSNSVTREYILREYKVVVEDCSDLKGSIEFFRKPDCTQQPAVLGSNQTYICAGYFGCPTSDPMSDKRHANWSYVDAQGNTHYLLPDQGRHFDIVYNRSYPEIIVGSTLTIIGVEEGDYQLTFQCNLATNQLHKDWNMTLHAPKTVEKKDVVTILIVCILGGLFLLLLMSFLIAYHCCRPEIHYRVYSRIGKLRTRSEEEEGYYDACIIHSEDNEEFVDEITQPLIKKNYKIFTSHNIPAGSPETKEAEHIDKSMCAILVLSRKEIEDKRVELMCAVAIQSCGNNFLVIEKEDVEKDSWKKAVAEKEEAIKNLPQMCKTLKWQGKMSKRQIKNFHYSIRLRLPKPPVTKRQSCVANNQRIPSDSSTIPLMSGQNTSVASVSSVIDENPDSRRIQKRNGSRDVSDSSEQVGLSSSGNNTQILANNEDLRDDVFTPSSARPMPNKHKHPQKQLSDDSGKVNSP